jgi:hypothetical protein
VQYCDGIAEERSDVQLLGVQGVVVTNNQPQYPCISVGNTLSFHCPFAVHQNAQSNKYGERQTSFGSLGSSVSFLRPSDQLH